MKKTSKHLVRQDKTLFILLVFHFLAISFSNNDL